MSCQIRLKHLALDRSLIWSDAEKDATPGNEEQRRHIRVRTGKFRSGAFRSTEGAALSTRQPKSLAWHAGQAGRDPQLPGGSTGLHYT